MKIKGIWLVRVGDCASVRVEIADKWVEVLSERIDGPFSHIVEPGGVMRAAQKAFGCPVEASDLTIS